MDQQLKQIIASTVVEATDIRHHLHAHPELGWHEQKTVALVTQHLNSIEGIEFQTTNVPCSVVAILKGDQAGPTIALRADMDALPIEEIGTPAYRSKNSGVMHACGHDGHTAILLAVAKVLGKTRSRWGGTVKFIFQPAEEGGGGALKLCEAGALKNPDVDVIFGLHGWTGLPCGTIATKPGPLMAAESHVEFTIEGTGCHAAMPHLGTDQVLIAARIIDALQSIRSRTIAPTEPFALSICKIDGSTAVNIIPARVTAAGTMRTTDPTTRDQAGVQIKTMVEQIALAHGAKGSVHIQHNYPVTANDPQATDYVINVAKDLLGAQHTIIAPSPVMGAEDFSYYLERVPGCFFFLGIDKPTAPRGISLHHPAFDFNDDALATGVEIFTALVFHAKQIKAALHPTSPKE